jgi:hypothetical protein
MNDRPHRTIILLLLVLALAGIVRFTALGFGLPHTVCRPDEETIVSAAQNVMQGRMNPGFFSYPSFCIYACAGMAALLKPFFWLVGYVPAESDGHPLYLFILLRILSATLGTASVLVIFRIAETLWNSRVALLASLFMSLCFLHARDSHFGTTDVPMTFFALLAVYAAIRCHDRMPVMRDYALGGIAAGAAISTKYGAIASLAPMILVHYVSFLDAHSQKTTGVVQSTRSRIMHAILGASLRPRLWAFLGMALVVFVAITPFSILDWSRFSTDFIQETVHLSEGHNITGEPTRIEQGWTYHLKYSLPFGAGIGMFLTGIAGMLLSSFRLRSKAVALWICPLLVYFMAGHGYTVFVRYMIPVTPFLCIGAAYLVCSLTERSKTPLAAAVITICTACIILAEPAVKTLHFDRLMLQRDNRLVVAQWMASHLPKGCIVHQAGLRYGQIQLPETFIAFDHAKTKTPPDYILVQQHPLLYSRIPEGLAAMISSYYEETSRFQAIDMTRWRGWFDPLDAFYLPMAGFAHIVRPGPNFILYRLRTAAAESPR